MDTPDRAFAPDGLNKQRANASHLLMDRIVERIFIVLDIGTQACTRTREVVNRGLQKHRYHLELLYSWIPLDTLHFF